MARHVLWTPAIPDGFDSSLYTYCVDAINYVTSPQMVTLNDSTSLDNDVSPYNVTDG